VKTRTDITGAAMVHVLKRDFWGTLCTFPRISVGGGAAAGHPFRTS